MVLRAKKKSSFRAVFVARGKTRQVENPKNDNENEIEKNGLKDFIFRCFEENFQNLSKLKMSTAFFCHESK